MLPVGEGLFPFSTPDEVRAAVVEIDARYRTHRRAARDLAREYFDARTVLRSLLERVVPSHGDNFLRGRCVSWLIGAATLAAGGDS